jgi:hypothetical protein
MAGAMLSGHFAWVRLTIPLHASPVASVSSSGARLMEMPPRAAALQVKNMVSGEEHGLGLALQWRRPTDAIAGIVMSRNALVTSIRSRCCCDDIAAATAYMTRNNSRSQTVFAEMGPKRGEI